MLSATMRKLFVSVLVFALLLLPLAAVQADAPQSNPSDSPIEREKRGPSTIPAQTEPLPTDQIIVKFKPSERVSADDAEGQAQLAESLSQTAGEPLSYFRAMSGGAHVLSLSEKREFQDVQAITQRLMEREDVEYAEPDQIFEHTLVPNDPLYSQQWHYFGTYGINLPTAWDTTTGSSSVVVAVIDTGITNHVDLSGRTVSGYDFISNSFVANDGGGRDNNPSDPGDWNTAGQCGSGSPARNSSWHGTHVAGTIGANTNNSLGVAGVSWGAKILPVRVLGRCGGYESDIADGMRWSAGLPVTGVPANANPAKVLNLSLGGYSLSCSSTYQSAIDAILAAGSSVVVSAGNSNYDAGYFSPANCNGVITVAATADDGYRAGYSNYGATVEVSAPGGDFDWDTGVLSTLNSGTTVPVADNYVAYQGTSMAAPHVSGVIALMLSVTPSLTPTQVLEILQNNTKAFNPGSMCNTPGYCGTGIIDAAAALKAAKFYNWSGGVTVTSSQPVVAVGRPHVGAEIASYNGFASGSTTAYIPMLFKTAFGGTYNSAFYVQNLSTTTTATLTIKYYTSSGVETCTVTDSLAKLASKGYWLPSVSCLPAGWVGGAVVTSSQPIVTVGRPHVGSEVMTYDGFPSGSSDAYLPMLFKGAFGGTYNSAFYVQNLSSTTAATLTIKYYTSSGVESCTETDTLAALASKGYWLPSVACLPAGWVGGVVISSTQPIVTVGRPHIGTQVTTYNGFSVGSLGSYVPMLFKNAYAGGSYDAALYVQNVHASSTATITVKYYNSSGVENCTVVDTVAPRASKGYWLPAETCLADGWVGGAVVTSDIPVVAVGRPHIGAQVTTYSGFSGGGTSQYLPMLFRDAFGGSYDSAFYVQNTTSNAATVTVNFYDTNGNLSCTRTDAISSRATLGYWLPSVTCP